MSMPSPTARSRSMPMRASPPRRAPASPARLIDTSVAQALSGFVADTRFPCVGAKAALARQSLQVIKGGNLADASHDAMTVTALQAFAAGVCSGDLFVSLVVVFAPAPKLSEAAFEQLLWQRLQAWHAIDRHQFDWDEAVSADPTSATFGFSLGGKAFYLVGLHPGASRPARRFQQPALVFNPHSQFEQLRADGRYDKLSLAITERDGALAGSRNPMLAEHGKGKAAPQYSGRAVGPNWACPFHAQGRPR